MLDRPPSRRDHLLTALASLASGIIICAAYVAVAPALAPYAPLSLSSWWFALIAFACTTALGVGIGYRRPRAVIISAATVALISSALYAALLALPILSPSALNIIGLVNYALTQASVTFFIVGFIGFIGAITGLLASYFWHDR